MSVSIRFLAALAMTLAGCAPPGSIPHPVDSSFHSPAASPNAPTALEPSEANRLLATARIEQRGEKDPLLAPQLLQRMAAAHVVYLGEKHDNPQHHAIELQVVESLLAMGKRPAIGLEFFSHDQTGWLLNYTMTPSPHQNQQSEQRAETFLRQQLGWGERPTWEDYAPIIRLARRNHLPLFGADLAKGTRVRIMRSGLAKMLALETKPLPLTHFKDDNYRTLMRQHLSSAHCLSGEGEAADRLYEAWLARNDAMSASIATMVQEYPAEPVVVVLGSQHIAYGLGVPERVAFRLKGVNQVVVGLTETNNQPSPMADQARKQALALNDPRFIEEQSIRWYTETPPGRAQNPCHGLIKKE